MTYGCIAVGSLMIASGIYDVHNQHKLRDSQEIVNITGRETAGGLAVIAGTALTIIGVNYIMNRRSYTQYG